jgi:hypothetical protein
MKVKSVNFLDIFVQAEHVNNSFYQNRGLKRRGKKKKKRSRVFLV